jgi:hypothetical protein
VRVDSVLTNEHVATLPSHTWPHHALEVDQRAAANVRQGKLGDGGLVNFDHGTCRMVVTAQTYGRRARNVCNVIRSTARPMKRPKQW